MLAKSLIVVFALSLTLSEACDINQKCDLPQDDQNVQAVIQAMEAFSLTLMNNMFSDTTTEGNVSFSAANIYVTLFAIMQGCKGDAQNELIATLLMADKDLQAMTEALVVVVNALEIMNTSVVRTQEITIENLSLGDGLFIQTGLNLVDTFTKLLQSLDVDSYPTDFTRAADWATKKINQWTYNQTGKRVPVTITSAVDPSTRIFISTAPFFSAKWPENFFDPAQNGVGTFRSSVGATNVVMMNTYKKLLFFDNGNTHAAIQLPFENPNFTLHIILPYGNVNAFDFVKSFNIDMWREIIQNSQEKDILVQIPKLSTSWTNEINEQIQGLKVKQIFQGADFGGMIQYTEGQLNVASINHSAGFTINEVGISMTDITPVSTNQAALGGTNSPPAFIVDKAFLFIVRHTGSNLIVFSSFVRQI